MRVLPPKTSYVPATSSMILDRQARSQWRELFARVETCPANHVFRVESSSALELKRHQRNIEKWVNRLNANIRTRVVDGTLYIVRNDITWNLEPPAFKAHEVELRRQA